MFLDLVIQPHLAPKASSFGFIAELLLLNIYSILDTMLSTLYNDLF